MRVLMITALMVLTLAPSSAFAQSTIDCSSEMARKQAANLYAKHVNKPKPFSASLAEKSTWPYLLQTFALTKAGQAHFVERYKSTGVNNAWLVVTNGYDIETLMVSHKGSAKAVFQACAYKISSAPSASPKLADVSAAQGRKGVIKWLAVTKPGAGSQSVELSSNPVKGTTKYNMAAVDVVLIYFSPSDYAVANEINVTIRGGAKATKE
jgi:hypothetical protein